MQLFAEPPGRLPEARQAVARKIRNWLIDASRTGDPLTSLLEGLTRRLREGGRIPLDRMALAFESLHAEQAGVGFLWTPEAGAAERTFYYSPESDEQYATSPFALAHQRRSWVVLRLAATPNDAFGVVPEFKADGYTHYVCVPVPFLGGTENAITFATRSAEGFSDEDLAFFGALVPTLSLIMEVYAARRTLDEVLSTYVGDEPRRRILSGETRRGQVTRIRSAIFFADMRGFTALSMQMSEEDVSSLLNAYYDCLVPAIEGSGGEVLKHMGDGILAIFRDRSDDFGGAAVSALDAARNALKAIEALNEAGTAPAHIELGIALHHGRAAYGNIGSGARLDFTVIGRDVNLASRIGRLCGQLGRRLLISRAFAEQLWDPLDEVGSFELAGVPEPQRIFAVPGI